MSNGIAGVIYSDLFRNRHLARHMLEALAPRRSEEHQTYHHKASELGSIGCILRHHDRKELTLVLDGTIDNITELHQQLVAAGHPPHHSSDPEELTANTLFMAYEVWGSDVFAKLDGPFACAILDEKKDTLFLARDRIGEKMLYWYLDEHYFFFSSNLHALLSTGQISQTPAVESFAAYLSLGYIPQDLSSIKNVTRLLPGYYVKYDLKRRATVHSYWSYSSYFLSDTEHEESETGDEEMEEILRTAYTSCMGGTTAEASIAYPVGEGVISALSSYHLSGRAEQVSLPDLAPVLADPSSPDFFDRALVSAVWHLGEPVADPELLSSWSFARSLSAQGVEIAISPLGARTFFGSHWRYTHSSKPKESMWMAMLKRIFLLPLSKIFHRPSTFSLLRHTLINPQSLDYLHHRAIFDQETFAKAAPDLLPLFEPEVLLQKFYQLTHLNPGVSTFSYLDVKTSLVDNDLYMLEQFGAAWGVDFRCPFLDHRLVEFLARRQGRVSEEMSQLLQKVVRASKESDMETLLHRPAFPFQQLNSSPVFRELLRKLRKGVLVESGFVSAKWLKKQVERRERTPQLVHQLWSLLVLEIWYHLYILRPPSSSPEHLSATELLSSR